MAIIERLSRELGPKISQRERVREYLETGMKIVDEAWREALPVVARRPRGEIAADLITNAKPLLRLFPLIAKTLRGPALSKYTKTAVEKIEDCHLHTLEVSRHTVEKLRDIAAIHIICAEHGREFPAFELPAYEAPLYTAQVFSQSLRHATSTEEVIALWNKAGDSNAMGEWWEPVTDGKKLQATIRDIFRCLQSYRDESTHKDAERLSYEAYATVVAELEDGLSLLCIEEESMKNAPDDAEGWLVAIRRLVQEEDLGDRFPEKYAHLLATCLCNYGLQTFFSFPYSITATRAIDIMGRGTHMPEAMVRAFIHLKRWPELAHLIEHDLLPRKKLANLNFPEIFKELICAVPVKDSLTGDEHASTRRDPRTASYWWRTYEDLSRTHGASFTREYGEGMRAFTDIQRANIQIALATQTTHPEEKQTRFADARQSLARARRSSELGRYSWLPPEVAATALRLETATDDKQRLVALSSSREYYNDTNLQARVETGLNLLRKAKQIDQQQKTT